MSNRDIIAPESYQEFCSFLNTACGIVLGANKEYLVTSRMRPVYEQFNLSGLDDLLAKIRLGNFKLKQTVVDAMTTNETLWFRDNHPYVYFKDKVLEELYASIKIRRPRIWSAACSSGQEPYSLSICADEFAKQNPKHGNRGIDIVATDISPSMLTVAQKGEYDLLALNRGMSKERLQSYFDQVPGGLYKLKDSVRKSVQFKALNLQESYIALGGKVDVIFCRNVLIYFSAENKTKIINQMHACLNPSGRLILGASESIGAAGVNFDMKQYPGGTVYIAR